MLGIEGTIARPAPVPSIRSGPARFCRLARHGPRASADAGQRRPGAGGAAELRSAHPPGRGGHRAHRPRRALDQARPDRRRTGRPGRRVPAGQRRHRLGLHLPDARRHQRLRGRGTGVPARHRLGAQPLPVATAPGLLRRGGRARHHRTDRERSGRGRRLRPDRCSSTHRTRQGGHRRGGGLPDRLPGDGQRERRVDRDDPGVHARARGGLEPALLGRHAGEGRARHREPGTGRPWPAARPEGPAGAAERGPVHLGPGRTGRGRPGRSAALSGGTGDGVGEGRDRRRRR